MSVRQNCNQTSNATYVVPYRENEFIKLVGVDPRSRNQDLDKETYIVQVLH